MKWYTHACTWTQGLLCIKCSKLLDVIPSIIHSFSSLSYDRSKASSKSNSPHNAIPSIILGKKKYCIHICLITDHYIIMNIWIFQDTVWYQLLHHSLVTSTCGKRYSLVPCTGFGQQAWPVKSLGIMLLDYFLCKHMRGTVYQQISQARKQLLQWMMECTDHTQND